MAWRRFLADAKAAGVDGLIVVDLPPEEDEELCLPAKAAGLNFIRLATPTTDDKRLPAVLRNTAGFVYYVSIAGITGTRSAADADISPGGDAAEAPYRSAGRRRLRHPQRRQQAAAVAKVADGAVVGSALVGSGRRPISTARAAPRRACPVRCSAWCASWRTSVARSKST